MATGVYVWTTFPLEDVFPFVLVHLYSREDKAAVNLVSRAWRAGMHKHLPKLGRLELPPRPPATFARHLSLYTGVTDLELQLGFAQAPDRTLFYQQLIQCLTGHSALRKLDLYDCAMDTEAFRQLGVLTRLQSLSIRPVASRPVASLTEWQDSTALLHFSDLKGLTELDLHSGGPQQSLEVLRGMPFLQDLNVEVQPEADTSPLSSLRHLTSVRLRGVSPQGRQQFSLLTSLKRLEYFDVQQDTRVRYLSTLTELTYLQLQQSDFTGNAVGLDGLQHLRQLKHLRLELQHTADLTLVTSLSKLETLEFYSTSNALHDMQPLAGLPCLDRLKCHGGEMRHVSSLGRLTSLTHVELYSEGIYDYEWLDKLTRVQSLQLACPVKAQVASLAALVGLTQVLLNGVDDNGMGCLASLPSLQAVAVVDGLMTDLGFANSGLQCLTELVLVNARDLVDISSLQALPDLRWLQLDGCTSVDWSGLEGLTGLVILSMMDTQFADISLLSSMTNLRVLDIRGTPVPGQAHTEIHRMLPGLRRVTS